VGWHQWLRATWLLCELYVTFREGLTADTQDTHTCQWAGVCHHDELRRSDGDAGRVCSLRHDKPRGLAPVAGLRRRGASARMSVLLLPVEVLTFGFPFQVLSVLYLVLPVLRAGRSQRTPDHHTEDYFTDFPSRKFVGRGVSSVCIPPLNSSVCTTNHPQPRSVSTHSIGAHKVHVPHRSCLQ